MKRKTIRLFPCFMLLAFCLPSIAAAAPEQRIALVIGNSAYSSGPLKSPVNDAAAMSAQLQKLGFTVILKMDANLRGMEGALADFGDRLKQGGVGLFYYAGHGLQVGGVNYLVPVEARINRESDIRHETLDLGKVLNEMASTNNGLNIVILDACRDNPYYPGFRNVARGLAGVSNAPMGMFISYSTGTNRVVKDGGGGNSPYTKALLENIAQPGLTINKVFMNVRSKLMKETGQVPWELSSLDRDFFFVSGSPERLATAVPAGKATYDLDDANRKLEEEQRRLAEESAAFAKKKALEENRQMIAAERERLKAEQEKARQAEARRLVAEKASVEKERQKTAEERKRLAAEQEEARRLEEEKASFPKEKVQGEKRRKIAEEAGRLATEQKAERLAVVQEAGRPAAEQETERLAVLQEAQRLEVLREAHRLAVLQEVQRLAAEERERAEKSTTLAMAKPPLQSKARETAKENRFIAYKDGTVLDTSTNLMWAAKDNGRDIKWANAKSYCENYRGGGYKDWRMPTQDELAGLYDDTKSYKSACGVLNLTKLIRLTCSAPWASETRGSDAALFYFLYGSRSWVRQSYDRSARALPVRSGK
jgi:uncharacterized caspase-like protein